RKEDLYQQGQDALNRGDIIASSHAFCEVARIDPKFRDAAQNCVILRDQAQRETVRNEQRFNDCRAAFDHTQWNQAEALCSNVRGLHADEAQQMLAKIARARGAESKILGRAPQPTQPIALPVATDQSTAPAMDLTFVGRAFLPIFVAAVAMFVWGALWYSPVMFARPRMKAMGLDPRLDPNDQKMTQIRRSGGVAAYGQTL